MPLMGGGGSVIIFPANRSTVVGAGETIVMCLPYRVLGTFGLLIDCCAFPEVIVIPKMRHHGDIVVCVKNLGEKPVHITPKMRLVMMQAKLGWIWDVDGNARRVGIQRASAARRVPPRAIPKGPHRVVHDTGQDNLSVGQEDGLDVNCEERATRDLFMQSNRINHRELSVPTGVEDCRTWGCDSGAVWKPESPGCVSTSTVSFQGIRITTRALKECQISGHENAGKKAVKVESRDSHNSVKGVVSQELKLEGEIEACGVKEIKLNKERGQENPATSDGVQGEWSGRYKKLCGEYFTGQKNSAVNKELQGEWSEPSKGLCGEYFTGQKNSAASKELQGEWREQSKGLCGEYPTVAEEQAESGWQHVSGRQRTVAEVRANQVGQPGIAGDNFGWKQIENSACWIPKEDPGWEELTGLTLAKQLSLEFPSCFNLEDGKCVEAVTIGLKDLQVCRPIKFASQSKSFPLSIAMEQHVCKELASLEKRGIIKQVEVGELVNYSQAIVLDKGVDESGAHKGVRITLDNRAINTMFTVWKSPLENPLSLVSKVPSEWQWFSLVDIKDGYYNLKLDTDLQNIFGFELLGKRFKYQRLVQGFASSCGLFHSTVQHLLCDIKPFTQHLQYIDDVLVGAHTKLEHDRRLHTLITRFEKVGFKLSIKKLHLAQKHIDFLGYSIVPGSFGLDAYIARLKTSLPHISGRHSLQQALGLINFLRPHTKGCAELLESLYQTLSKVGKVEKWGEVNNQFQGILSQVMARQYRLALHNRSSHPEFRLFTDWSSAACGFSLWEGDNLVSLGSTSNKGWPTKCSSHAGECYAIYVALKKIRWMIKGGKVRVLTDGKSAAHLFHKDRVLTEEDDIRLARIMFYVQSNFSVGFELKVTHISGSHNIEADLLSRWKKETAKSSSMRMGKHVGCLHMVDHLSSREHKPLSKASEDVIEEILMKAHHGHFGVKKTMQRITSMGWTAKWTQVQKYVDECVTCQLFKRLPAQESFGWLQHLVGKGETLVLDIVGPLPETLKGNRYIVSVMDYMTRFAMSEAVVHPGAHEVVTVLEKWGQQFHFPLQVMTDQAKVFTGRVFRTWAKDRGIRVLHSPVHAHKSAGRIERYQGSLMTRIKRLGWAFGGAEVHWDCVLHEAVQLIRETEHGVTLFPPRELFLGLDVVGNMLPKGEWDAKLQLGLANETTWRLKHYGVPIQKREIFVQGDRVWRYAEDHLRGMGVKGKKLLPLWTGPFLFWKYLSIHRCLIIVDLGKGDKLEVTHIDFLRKCSS